jgi:hypothetical protein
MKYNNNNIKSSYQNTAGRQQLCVIYLLLIKGVAHVIRIREIEGDIP